MTDPPITDDPRTEYAPDTPEHEYREAAGLGSTDVRRIDTSVDAWRHYRKEGIETTDAMEFGTVVHTALLEPEEWRGMLDRPDEPDVDLSSSKRKLAELLADDPTRQADKLSDEVGVKESTIQRWRERDDITTLADHIRTHGPAPDPEHVEQAQAIRDRVMQHPLASGMLEGETETEVSFWWGEEIREFTVQCKGRADFVFRRGGQLIAGDLKTTGRSAAPGSYARTIGRRRYHLQAAHYASGLEATRDLEVAHWTWIVVETEPPHHVSTLYLDEDSARAGRRRRREALESLIDVVDGDAWGGYDVGLHKVELKPWEM